MKRWALFIPSLRGGGAERAFLNLAGGLVERGFAPDLVVANARGALWEWIPKGVNVVDLAAGRVSRSFPGLIRYLRRARPAALISAMDHSNFAAILARSASGVDVRVVSSVHKIISRPDPSGRLGDRLTPLLARWLYPRAYKVVAVSRAVRADLLRTTGIEPSQVQVIGDPVVTKDLSRLSAGPPDHPWFASAAAPVILGAGRLAYHKDFGTLIRAFALLRRHHRARLMILGEGDQRRVLERLVSALRLEGEVSLPGYVGIPWPYISRAEVLALSSISEGFGMALVEAMACGTSVVSTNCGGPAEILEQGRYGRLAPVGDPQALADEILWTLENPASASALKRRAEDFSVERITRQYLEIFDG